MPNVETEVHHLLATTTDEAEQIEAIAQVRGYFMPADENHIKTIASYISGAVSLSNAVHQLAAPVEEAYTTADYGRAFWQAELVGRNQRTFFINAEEAVEQWGEPVALTEPNPETRQPSTEGHLWDLYYAILMGARKIPWSKTEQQGRLVDLVRGLKARPDPQRPDDPTDSLRNDWIFASGKLWSNLTMLGPSARESWNDMPGCGAGYALPEIHGWQNVNAFVATLSAEKVSDLWLYGIWALRDGLEEINVEKTRAEELHTRVSTAAVWILTVGKAMYERCQAGGQAESVPVHTKPSQQPWYCTESWTLARWNFWRQRLESASTLDSLNEETQALVACALSEMALVQHYWKEPPASMASESQIPGKKISDIPFLRLRVATLAAANPCSSHCSLLATHRAPRLGEDERHILENITREAAKIDALGEVRGWFMPLGDEPTNTLSQYLFGSMLLPVTVERLVSPVDEAYSTSDCGKKFPGDNSSSADTPLGPEKYDMATCTLPTPNPPTRKRSTESQLWNLYYGILHAAKKIPWSDDAGQEKLISLVRALKVRPDPPLPLYATEANRMNWIWASGMLWSILSMLGPSACENWDHCTLYDHDTLFTLREIHAWHNVNAFVVRLTRCGICDFLNYGGRAMRYAPDGGGPTGMSAPDLRDFEVHLSTAAVRLAIVGRELLEEFQKANGEWGIPSPVSDEKLQLDGEGWHVKRPRPLSFRMQKRDCWREEFRTFADVEHLDEAYREYAADAAIEMHRLESESLR